MATIVEDCIFNGKNSIPGSKTERDSSKKETKEDKDRSKTGLRCKHGQKNKQMMSVVIWELPLLQHVKDFPSGSLFTTVHNISLPGNTKGEVICAALRKPSVFKKPISATRLQGLLHGSFFQAQLPSWAMDLSHTPGPKGRAAVPANGITETKSPLPSPPITSPSSPSSPLSSPASPVSPSSSFSPGTRETSYHNNIIGGVVNSLTPGDLVSSTSASLAPPSSHSTPPSSASCEPLVHLSCSPHTNADIQTEGETEIYDPFHPTDGEREGGVGNVDEEEGEKYDPFDPTGSPPSERGEVLEQGEAGRGRDRKYSASSHGSEAGMGEVRGEVKNEAPPDSTEEALSVLPLSPRSLPLPLRRRLDRTKDPRVKGRDRNEKAEHSDHSEIEEGEIVGAAEREGGNRGWDGVLSSGSPFLLRGGAKPERILRVLDGDSFVSVRADSDWPCPVMPGTEDGEPMDDDEDDVEEEEVEEEQDGKEDDEGEEVLAVEAGDLRRKLVSRRQEKYRSSGPSSLSPQPLLLPSEPHSPSPLPPAAEKDKSRKSSKNSKERERRKRKEGKAGEKEERRRRKRREKDVCMGKSMERKDGERERGLRSQEEKAKEDRGRSSRSDSRRKKRRRSTPEPTALPCSRNSSVRQMPGGRSWSNASEDQRDGDASRRKQQREHNEVSKSTSRNRGSSRRSKGSIERREREKDNERERDRERDRERRQDGRPVVPPSIQDLNGSDLFAIKRTITVTTTTTTTLPGSPATEPSSPRSPSQSSDKPRKRKKKRRRRHSDEELESGMGRHGSRSLSSPLSRYHGYDSDHFSDKQDADLLSLDGEALDSDYPSIDESPASPHALGPAAPKPKNAAKPGHHHLKKKSRTGKKAGQSESASTLKVKGKVLSTSSLSPSQPTTGLASPLTAPPSSLKGARKMGKDKERGEKGGKKESGRSGRSKKLSVSGVRKAKLQSKVSVLVREGVSSTTGGPVGSGKLGMELLGTGGSVGGSGGPAVGGSIAVVFRRDNESRSPFLKPCSEPLLLSGRNKDMGHVGKRSLLAATPSSSLANPTVTTLKSKKAKPSSTTSSSASSPSLSLATKRRRRLAKKTREKGLTGGMIDVEAAKTNCCSDGGGWGGSSADIQLGVGMGTKPSSPHTVPAGPTPSSSSSSLSSSSSSTSVLPPSSPPHTPPPSLPASRDTRESSPDSQTVDSSSNKLPPPPPPPPPPPSAPTLPWSLQTGVDCTAGGVLALTALLFKMEEANIASRAKAQEFIHATSQILSHNNQNQSMQHVPASSSSQVPNSSGPTPAQFILHSSVPLVGCTKTPPTHLHPNISMGGGCAQTPPPPMPTGFTGGSGDSSDLGWDNESKDPDKYLKKLHTQERAVEEVKLAIKPYYQRKDINKDEYKDILRKAVHKICHSRTGEINPVKVSNLVKLYVQRYKYFRKHGRKMDEEEREEREMDSSY
ncbi:hypothetical protein UPYG_G00111630 [Umbra pygmaea]|uniref:SFR19-like C-terminal domain-containing protein n=1 Tax=Umbra pygmaea TaxID=75934 RepID=A0ABD0X3E4_UMBPY